MFRIDVDGLGEIKHFSVPVSLDEIHRGGRVSAMILVRHSQGVQKFSSRCRSKLYFACECILVVAYVSVLYKWSYIIAFPCNKIIFRTNFAILLIHLGNCSGKCCVYNCLILREAFGSKLNME